MKRREFNRWLAGLLAASAGPGLTKTAAWAAPARSRLRVGAIQMQPRLGDVAANLEQAERLIREALRRGAEWIALPEMFTSAAAFHEGMLGAIRPVGGEPLQFLQRLARAEGCTLGGSFLASDKGEVYNSFLLVTPDGQVRRHDKDYPSFWENCVSIGGKDDGVLDSPKGPIGAALCWELIRSQTARRLFGRVGLLMAGSCWWTLPDEAEALHPRRVLNRRLLREAPLRMARMLGVPVVHGAHSGPFNGFYGPELPDVPYDSRYIGEAMIVGADGAILARRDAEDGPGVVVAEIELGGPARPSESIPERFWIPEEMPESWQVSWRRWLASGARYYQAVTQRYLQTGEIVEYKSEFGG